MLRSIVQGMSSNRPAIAGFRPDWTTGPTVCHVRRDNGGGTDMPDGGELQGDGSLEAFGLDARLATKDMARIKTVLKINTQAM